MTIGQWDFSKLPQSEYEKALAAIEQRDGKTLRGLHAKYTLSTYIYCCGGDDAAVLGYFIEAKNLGYFG